MFVQVAEVLCERNNRSRREEGGQGRGGEKRSKFHFFWPPGQVCDGEDAPPYAMHRECQFPKDRKAVKIRNFAQQSG
jgi:hypothetical protein